MSSFKFMIVCHWTLDIKRLDDGDGIEATLMRHSACWHKACRVRFSQTKLEQLEKKQITDCGKERKGEAVAYADSF